MTARRALHDPAGAARFGAEDASTIRPRTEGRSSTGRAPVSKTGGCRFESCRPCRLKQAQTRLTKRASAYLSLALPNRLKPLETAGIWRSLAHDWPRRVLVVALIGGAVFGTHSCERPFRKYGSRWR
jgi:hypothetical protein